MGLFIDGDKVWAKGVLETNMIIVGLRQNWKCYKLIWNKQKMECSE